MVTSNGAAMQVIPLSPVPSQTLRVTLNGQPVRLAIYTLATGLYADVYLNEVPIALCVRAWHGVALVPAGYLGFQGNLFFWDTYDSSDPTYDGLGSRYLLYYVQPGEVASWT